MQAFLIIAAVVASYAILYFIIRAAVRDGIIAARKASTDDSNDGTQISKVSCPSCGKRHDMDYPACPGCGNKY
ncbi:MAG: hypothetical protein FWC78_07830 [Defluviitaleaceae bacterium]|nr:hypothetical protein [Defluviitaleaceae bacterium]